MFKNAKNVIGKVSSFVSNNKSSFTPGKIRKNIVNKGASGAIYGLGGIAKGGAGLFKQVPHGIGKFSNTIDDLTEKTINKRLIKLEHGLGSPSYHISNLGKAAINMASPFLKESKHNSLLGVRVNGLGMTLLGGGLVAAGAIGETKNYLTQTTRGQVDTSTTGFAPRLPSYSFGEQAGATGDLVFALNNNRRG